MMLRWQPAAAASGRPAASMQASPPTMQRPVCTRLLVQLDAAASGNSDGGSGGSSGGCRRSDSGRSSGEVVAQLERELASLRATLDRRRRAKRLTRTTSDGGLGGNAHAGKHHGGVGGRAARALTDAVHEVDSVLGSLHSLPSPSSASPRSPAFSPVASPECLPSPSAAAMAAFCAEAEDCTELARPKPRRSTTPERPRPLPAVGDDDACCPIPAPDVGSPERRSAFSSPTVAPRPPSKRRPDGEGSERRREGRETILLALIEAGVCVNTDDEQQKQQQKQDEQQPQLAVPSHPHKALVRQLENSLAQQRPDPSRVLRLAERLLAATVASLAGAAGDHNAGGGTLAMDILGLPELRERVLSNLAPRDLCRCRRVSRQLMTFGDEALGKLRMLDSADWGGITAFQLERRLPLSAPSLLTIRWDGTAAAAHASGRAAVLTDDMLRVVARAAGPSLRSLSLRGCSRLTECGLLAVAEYCGTRLTRLDLRGCLGLTDACLNLMSERCSCLRSVDLSDSALITDAAVGLLIARCPSLTSLSLARCASITDATVAILVTSAAESHSHSRAGTGAGTSLGRLDLQGCLGVTGESCALLASTAGVAGAGVTASGGAEGVTEASSGPSAVSFSSSSAGVDLSAADGDVAVASLASTLHSVDLSGTGATDEEQRWLHQSLQQHQSF
eukprot:COSAG06_NODE_2951_length_6039_cov_5.078114_3_plen_676_part_00